MFLLVCWTDSVRRLLQSQLSNLHASEVQVLRVCACIDGTFDINLIEAAIRGDDVLSMTVASTLRRCAPLHCFFLGLGLELGLGLGKLGLWLDLFYYKLNREF